MKRQRNEYMVPGNHGNKTNMNDKSNKNRTQFEESKISRKQSISDQMAQNLERLPSKLDDDDEEEEEEEDDIEDGDEKITEGGYDPKEFESLEVSSEVSALFSNILLYTPASIELDYKLKPFIPEYIPTVGDIDAFIKVSLIFSPSFGLREKEKKCLASSHCLNCLNYSFS